MIGHNQPSFDNVVEENLLRGFLIVHLQALQRCIRDPRCKQRHQLVLVALTECTNGKTGACYPGRAWLREHTQHYGPNGDAAFYSDGAIANALSDLARWNYLVTARRAPEGGGRALAHYQVRAIPLDELQAEIARYCAQIKESIRKPFSRAEFTKGDDVISLDDVTKGDEVRPSTHPQKTQQNRSDFTKGDDIISGGEVRAEFTNVGGAEFTTVGGQYLTKGTSKKDISPTPSGQSAAEPLAPQPQPQAASGAAKSPRPKKVGTLIDPDWRPAQAQLDWVRARYKANDRQLAREAEKFRDHHTAKGTLSKDWAASWRTWWGTGYHGIPQRADTPVAVLEAPKLDLATVYEDEQLARDLEKAAALDRGDYSQ